MFPIVGPQLINELLQKAKNHEITWFNAVALHQFDAFSKTLFRQ